MATVFNIKKGDFEEDNLPPVMLFGEGPPKDLGNNFYIDTIASVLYGPFGSTSLKGIDGKNGKDGLSIKGDRGDIGPSGKDGLSIKGDSGKNGINGLDGKDGREVELRTNKTHFQWRYVGEEWIDLALLPQNLIGGGGGHTMRKSRDVDKNISDGQFYQWNAALKKFLPVDVYTKAEIDALLAGLVDFGDPSP